MSDDIDAANYADLKTLEDRVRRTLYAHGFNENTSTPLGDMNSLCRNLVQDAAATDAELAALQARLAEAEALIEEIRKAMGGYPDSDLVSLPTTLKVRDGVAEKAEARVGHLEAECAKLRRLVSEAYRDGFAAACFPNANVDDAWPQSMTFADLNAENNHD